MYVKRKFRDKIDDTIGFYRKHQIFMSDHRDPRYFEVNIVSIYVTETGRVSIEYDFSGYYSVPYYERNEKIGNFILQKIRDYFSLELKFSHCFRTNTKSTVENRIRHFGLVGKERRKRFTSKKKKEDRWVII